MRFQAFIQTLDAIFHPGQCFCGCFWRQATGDKDLGILNGTDDTVLDTLLIQASPPGFFKVMQVCALGEAAFHQIAPSDPVPPCFLALRLFYGLVDELLT